MDNITKIVNNLRQSTQLSSQFNIESLVTKLGGKIEYVSNPNIDAFIQKEDNTFKIVVDISKSIKRQKFSIAHEIGHLMMHMNYFDEYLWANVPETDSRIYRYGHDVQELEANEFAAELLMPKDEFIQVAEQFFLDDLYYLDDIANHFDVSVDSVRYRGHKLNLWDMNSNN